jgi:pimeloyl-ACP methyl ester carboxylesterase
MKKVGRGTHAIPVTRGMGKTMHKLARLLVLLHMGLAVPAAFSASLTVGTDDGTGGNCALFGCPVPIYEQLYSSSSFAGPISITGISFPRVDADGHVNVASGGANEITPAVYTFSFSTTTLPVGGLDNTNLLSNIGPDNQMFFSGTLSGTPNVLTISGSPFNYDPATGNLLLTITQSSSDVLGGIFFDSMNGTAGNLFSRAAGIPGPTGTSGFGFVTIFNTSPFRSSPLTVSLLDPVPMYVGEAGINSDVDSLAALASVPQTVTGVAADGAAKVVVRVSVGNATGPITLRLSDEDGPTTDSPGAGYLTALPDNGSNSGATGGQITVNARNNGSGPATAFAVYHAPQDFVRVGVGADRGAATRTVSIQAVENGSSGTQSVRIVRPPVVLIHGIWGGNNDWYGPNGNDGLYQTLQSVGSLTISFGQYDSPFILFTSVPSYSAILPTIFGNSLGFMYGATAVLPQIQQAVSNYKQAKAVAAVRADIVAHSMGGDVVRTLPQVSGFLDPYNYNLGVVHKLITIGTPHQGSPLATGLLQANNSCVRTLLAYNGLYAFSSVDPLFGATINGGIGDLQAAQAATSTTPAIAASAAIVAFHNGSAIIPTAMIGSQLSSGQLATAGSGLIGKVLTALCGAPIGIISPVPSDPLALALNPAGWPTLFVSTANPGGASDGIVSLSSEFDGESTYAVGLPFVIPNAVHSSAAESLGFGPPGELDQASGVPGDVFRLLNTPVSSSVFEAKP